MGKKKLDVLSPLSQALQKLACLPTVCQSDLEHPHRTSQGCLVHVPQSRNNCWLIMQTGGEECSCLQRELVRSCNFCRQRLAKCRGQASQVPVGWLQGVCPSHTLPDPCSVPGGKCSLPPLAPLNREGSGRQCGFQSFGLFRLCGSSLQLRSALGKKSPDLSMNALLGGHEQRENPSDQ